MKRRFNKVILIQERRAQILDAALKVFSEKGYHKTKVEDISREIGIAKGTIYLYFRSKKRIFLSLIDHIILSHMENFIEVIENVQRENLDEREKLETIMMAAFNFFNQQSGFFKIVFYEGREFQKEIAKKISRILSKLVDISQNYFEDGKRRGIFRDLDMRVVLPALPGMFLIFSILGPQWANFNIPPEKLVHELIDLYWKGIQSEIPNSFKEVENGNQVGRKRTS